MTLKQLMIHYGELSTKGRNRKMFQKRMAEHIRSKTKHIENIKIHPHHDVMHLTWEEADYSELIEIIRYIPGVARFEPVYSVEKDLDSIKAKALELFEELEVKAGDSFRIVGRRSDKQFPYDTMQLQREVGTLIGQNYPEMTVDLKKSTYKLTVNILQNGAYLSLTSYPGLGGFPYGSSGKGLLMLSGGIDSPVAGYQMMKRGLKIEAVHFSSPPYTSPQALEKTKKLTARLARYGTPITFHNIPFARIQEAIKTHIPDDFSMTVMRRMMLRIMDALLVERKAMAIVNGESLGQVASQTLQSMSVINEVTTTPILRPLIAVDKNEIIQIAEEIDTFDISNEPFEDCCTVFAPKTPKTKPKLASIESMEQALDVEALVRDAVESMTTVVVDEHYQPEGYEAFSSLL